MKYAIERQYLLPVYQHLEIEADSAEEGCRKAIEHDDWETSEQDFDSSRETTINALRQIPDGKEVESPGGFIYEKPDEAHANVPRQFRENPPPAVAYLILKSGEVGTIVFPDAYASCDKAAQAIAEDVKAFGTDENAYEIIETKIL